LKPFEELEKKWDGNIATLRDMVIPAMNDAIRDGLIPPELQDEISKRWDELLGLQKEVGAAEVEAQTLTKTPWWAFLHPVLGLTAAIETTNQLAQGRRPEEFMNLPNRQFGGIVPGPIGHPIPIMAHGGEEYLGVQNIGRSMGNTVTINLGVLPGDDVTIRKVARAIKDVMGEDGRRNMFSPINLGYGSGNSSR